MKSLSARLAALPCLLLLCLFAASESKADPVVITSGFWTTSNTGGGSTSTQMSGDGISISGGTGDFSSNIGPHRPGDIISISFSYAGLDHITVNGYTNNFPYGVGNNFQFAGDNVVVPDTLNPTVTLPFTFTGHVFVEMMTSPGTRFIDANLVGQGTATLNFTTIYQTGGLPPIQQLRSITYTFAPAAAVPEPAPILLLGTGLAYVAGAARRRRAGPAGRMLP